MARRALVLPVILLSVALAGIVNFSQGLHVVDTVGLLVSGVVAGASLAALAAGWHGPRRS